MKIIKCCQILYSSQEIGFKLLSQDLDYDEEGGTVYFARRSTLKLKGDDGFVIDRKYRILQYKICHNYSSTAPRILIGHPNGSNDWVVQGFMEEFIHDKEYYLMKIYLEEVG